MADTPHPRSFPLSSSYDSQDLSVEEERRCDEKGERREANIAVEVGGGGGGGGGGVTASFVRTYEFVSRASDISLADLPVKHLQSLLISLGGNSEEIKCITSKSQLLQLVRSSTFAEATEGPHEFPGTVRLPPREVKRHREVGLGEGGYGEVYLGNVLHTPCAIKEISLPSPLAVTRLLPSIRKEVDILRRNQHPHIVGLLGVHVEDAGDGCGQRVYIIMPLMAGNLKEYMREVKKSGAPLSLYRALTICYEILLGLVWLHSQDPRIVHLDLKMENVLFDEAKRMKIADFGLSGLLEGGAEMMQSATCPGNLGHMAPEVMEKKPFNEKADVYGMGVLMWEVLRGHEWEEEICDQIEAMGVDAGNLDDFEDEVKRLVLTRDLRPSMKGVDWPPNLVKLIESMWARDPNDRPQIAEIMSNSGPEHLRLYDMLLASAMDDVNGREFWKSTFEDKYDFVSWDVFKELLYEHIGVPLPVEKKGQIREDPALIRLLYLKIALDAEKPPQVSLERFGKVVDSFGPLSDGPKFLDRVEQTVSQPWFYAGDITTEGVTDLLKGQRDGTFIVRFSSRVGVPFTLSVCQRPQSACGRVHIQQYRVYKCDKGMWTVGRSDVIAKRKCDNKGRKRSISSISELRFKSLEELVSDPTVTSTLHLLSPDLRHVGQGEKLRIANPLSMYEFDESSE